MKKQAVCFILVITLLTGGMPAFAAAGYSDVPSGHWAEGYINRATQLSIVNGVGNGRFGLGTNVTRAQFAAMLTRLFAWKTVTPAVPSFSDNRNKDAWYYSAVETAAANGAVAKGITAFRPEADITREEMAVMLVCALGYETLAASVAGYDIPFTDVTENVGYITIASSFGIINGTTPTTFAPRGSATREQAAAMIIRLYERWSAKVDWLHAFYAIASASQMDAIPNFDALTYGWSALQYSESGGVYLNTTSSGGNEFCIPSGYTKVTQLAQSSNVSANLNVYMTTWQTVKKADGTTSDPCREILLSADNRAAAISQIIAQLKSSAYLSGVTIDFEGLRGAELKAGLNAFLKDLRAAADSIGKKVYVCVQPTTSDGQYYDAYDYRTIGAYCDKVILMAHDYQATSMPAALMTAGFTVTPLTPINEIYCALKAITDQTTGVEDIGKVALAVSFGTEQWQLQNGQVINSTPYHPDTASVYKRLIDTQTSIHYSEQYENAYATFYNSENNTHNVVWYEDERSISAKIELARMFGINGISVWRLGLIPNYADGAGREIDFDVMNLLLGEKAAG